MNAATFFGAFLLALIYSTKPDEGSSVTIARSGDTSLVVEAPAADSTVGDLTADTVAAVPLSSPVDTGPAALPVIPADIDVLKRERPIIPVVGVEAKNLVDSFDEARGSTRRHDAIDIAAARNTPVLAAVAGTVLKLHDSEPGGLTIYMSDSSALFIMMYGHLESYRRGLKDGGTVKRGDTIGFVGSSGNADPLAPHLHFQIMRNGDRKEWWKGIPVNPFPIFRPRG